MWTRRSRSTLTGSDCGAGTRMLRGKDRRGPQRSRKTMFESANSNGPTICASASIFGCADRLVVLRPPARPQTSDQGSLAGRWVPSSMIMSPSVQSHSAAVRKTPTLSHAQRRTMASPAQQGSGQSACSRKNLIWLRCLPAQDLVPTRHKQGKVTDGACSRRCRIGCLTRSSIGASGRSVT